MSDNLSPEHTMEEHAMEEQTMEEHLLATAEGPQQTPTVGERISGTVVAVSESHVFVDVGAKAEASISVEEFRSKDEEPPAVGETVLAYVTADDPEIELSRALGEQPLDIEAIQQARDLKLPVRGKVTALNKGGLEIDLNGVRAFCPLSQIELGRCEDAERYVGETIDLRIQEIKEGGRNVVVSRKALLQEEQAEQADAIKEHLVEGAELDGEVRSIQAYGAFIDLGGGFQGMVHVSEIAHARIEHPNEALKEGEKVRVKVLKIQPDPKRPERKRIGLSIKALAGDPWTSGVAALKEGETVEGEVVRLQPYGAFIQLSPGVDGLAHVSELSDRHIKHPSEVLTIGQKVQARVLNVDLDAKRVSLSLKDASSEGSRDSRSRDGRDGRDSRRPPKRRESQPMNHIDPGGGGAQGLGTFGDLFSKALDKKKS
ncbi:MAG: S1 RNA-binding domain-containing protein [Deltaproteobacteria bacterium]|nr:S1 RNA-binding domain-containing protein [Deltaproteobacteria bacterium]